MTRASPSRSGDQGGIGWNKCLVSYVRFLTQPRIPVIGVGDKLGPLRNVLSQPVRIAHVCAAAKPAVY